MNFLFLQAYNNHDGKYQNLTAMMLKFEKLDATDLVNKMAMELKTMLESKMEALRVSNITSGLSCSKHR